MSENMVKARPKLLGVYILLAAILVVLLAMLSGIVLSVTVVAKLSAASQNDSGMELEAAQENDVTIADNYVILSTEHISNAYKTGDDSKLSNKDKETLEMATAILGSIIKDDMSDFEKEKAVYDWMTHNLQNDSGILPVVPTSKEDSDNPYGVLKYHNAVCVGYATTFRMFMQMMDIPCMVIHNYSLMHSWNLVQLDGDWYHTDIYSDAGRGNYTSFNNPDVMCDQEWDRNFFHPATSFKYNIGYRNATPVTDIFTVPSLIRQALESNKSMVSLAFPATLNNPQSMLVSNMIDQVTTLLTTSVKYADYYIGSRWGQTENGYILIIAIENLRGSSDVEISEEDTQKMDEAVNKAFGDLEIKTYEPYEFDESEW